MTLLVLPRQLLTDANGNPYSGAKLYVFDAGTSTPRATYTTNSFSQPHAHPVLSLADGRFPAVYINPDGGAVKITLQDANGVQISSDDNVPVQPLTQSQVGAILYPRTTAETNASVTPSNYAYEPGDARRYGLGDGSTATHTALTNALAANNVVYIVNLGTSFTYTASVTVPSNRRIIGQGWPKFLQGGHNINFLVLDDAVNVEITGIWVDGNGQGNVLSTYSNCAVKSEDTTDGVEKNCHVHHCRFTGFYSWCVTFAGNQGGASAYSYGACVDHNYIEDQVDEGINFYYMKKFSCCDNLIYNHAKEAIKASTSEDMDISGNQIYCAATGATDGPLINVGTDCAKVRIARNQCYKGNKGIGVEKRVSDVAITGNVCEGQLENGISVASTTGDTSPMKRISITGNVVRDPGEQGIWVTGISGQVAEAVTISGNSVYNSGNLSAAGGIQASQCEDVTITGNSVDTSGKEGIVTNNTTSATITGNTVRDTQQHGIRLTGTTVHGTVIGNHVHNANLANSSFNGVQIDTTTTDAVAAFNLCIGSASPNQFIGVYNQATNPMCLANVATNWSNAAVRMGSAVTDGYVYGDVLGVGNSAAATTPGTVVKKIQVYDQTGASLGYLPVYNAIT